MTRKSPYLSALFALVLSAIGFYFGTGLNPLWWLTWLAAIPVLLVAPRIPWVLALVLGFVAWAAGFMNQWSFFRSNLGIPVSTISLYIGGSALVFGLAVVAYRTFVRSGAVWRGALIFPSLWVLAEFINSRTSIHSTSGNLAYSQMNFLPILQIASITGIWGISFCIFLFAATAGILLGGYGSVRGRRWLGMGTSLVLLAVLGFGIWRMSSESSCPAAKVALVSSDLQQNLIAEKHDDALRLMSDYVARARAAAAQGAKIIVIPEKIAVITPADIEDVDHLMQAAANQIGAQIVVGVVHVTPDAKLNEARIYSPNGEILTYEKHHMLPPFESNLRPGTRLTEWQEPSGTWGAAICKDMDFPKMGRDYGSDGVGLLIVPAWDFVQDGWLHGRMAILRGVESGFSIARSPKNGILTVSDDRGRVIAQRASDASPFVTVIATVPVRNDATYYAQHGDWFAWSNAGLFVVLIISRWVVPPKSKPIPAPAAASV